METAMAPQAPLPIPPGLALTASQLDEVCQILARTLGKFIDLAGKDAEPIIWAFGSRATGRARPYSDLDLLITRGHPLDWRTRSALAEAFEASRLPFRVDVVEESGLPEPIAQRVRMERIALF